MTQSADLTIIGAGAAGLAAGIFAGESNPALKIIILDGAKSIGAKILVSGGGRCNVTNCQVSPSDFHAPKRLVERILKRFNEEDTVRWMASLGVDLKQEETGKMFPATNQARTVLTALVQRCRTLSIDIRSQHRVHRILPLQDHFRVIHQKGDLLTRRVIVATGGQSLPRTGSDGHGWEMVKRLGHSITPTFPALVPLLLDEKFVHRSLAGVSHEARLTTRINDKVVDRRAGSLLWTHFGISGPVVLDASRWWIKGTHQGQKTTIELSCLPVHTFEEADRWLIEKSRVHPQRSIDTLLSQSMPNRLVKELCEPQRSTFTNQLGEVSHSSLLQIPAGQLARQERQALARLLTELPLPVKGDRGWNFAEVTVGGVPLTEINPYSMESRILPGLYMIGEMLDCDGRIGGFNFQWAWSTGYIAGTSAALKSATPHP